MRIAFITPEFITEDYFSGGLANYLHRVSLELAARGHDVHVIVQSDRSESFSRGPVTVHRVLLRPRGRLGRALAGRALNQPEQWLRFAYAAWRKLETLNRQAKVDVVQVANYRACGLFVTAFSRVPSVTRLSTYQPAWNEAAGESRSPRRATTERLEWLQLRLAKHVIAPSRTLAKTVSSATRKQIEVLPSPMFIEAPTEDDVQVRRMGDRAYFLFVGRLQAHKGALVLADALPSVLRAIPDAHAVFVGKDMEHTDGCSTETHIRKRTVGFERRIHFLGEIRHEQLYPVMGRARLVVLPSLTDNLPNAMLESMALGRPVIGTIGASFDEVIEDGVSGFLVPSGDPVALAEKIIEAWSHPDLARLGEQARLAVARFAPEATVRAAVEYFQRVATER